MQFFDWTGLDWTRKCSVHDFPYCLLLLLIRHRYVRIICQQQNDAQGSDRYTRERRMTLHVCQLTLEVIVAECFDVAQSKSKRENLTFGGIWA